MKTLVIAIAIHVCLSLKPKTNVTVFLL